MELITLKTFDTPIEANVLKSKLESECITCVLFDENIVGLNPLYSIMIGGVKLKIDKEDLEKAILILNEIENTPYTDENNKVIICPKCGSDKILTELNSVFTVKGILAFFTALYFRIFPFYRNSVCKCKSCGKVFKKESIRA